MIRFTFVALWMMSLSAVGLAQPSSTTKSDNMTSLDTFSYALGSIMYSDSKKSKLVIGAKDLFRALKEVKAETATTTAEQAQQIMRLRNKVDSTEVDYAFGILWSGVMKKIGAMDIVNLEDCQQGYVDTKNDTPKMDMVACNTLVNNHVSEYQRKLAAERLESNKAFLKANRKKDGVTVTESGLQYKILMEGEGGEKPSRSDQVKVHYEGKLLDGTVFDSSLKRGQPTTFGVGQVIAGWTEGLQLMRTGATFQFFIPAELAYGARGVPQANIPPHAILIFTVELIEVL